MLWVKTIHRSTSLLLRELAPSVLHQAQFICFHQHNSVSFRLRSLSINRTMAGTSASKFTNRLSQERSPYLLQHAHNPVDWYPWGEEAFKKSREEDKLIFLSVGYSTCHWCHVMERESFENEKVAKVMNQNFVCVKVDREERPDVDQLYMAFVQATSGSGGWPMSVWLSPELLPVFGGTYFPPEDMYGRPGFITVLSKLATMWSDKSGGHEEMKSLGSQVMAQLEKFSFSGSKDGAVPSKDSWKTCFKQLERRFEPTFGGFSPAPKFPQPVYLRFLLDVWSRSPESDEGKKALKMTAVTLDKMATGGIHDHVSQGFARYSTDGKWHVPHFEKMMYDQGQLCASYAEAYLATKDALYSDIIRDIMTYVNRDMSHPLGGFYSAEDADSLPTFDSTEKKEGAFCVWTYEEISQHLSNPVAGKENLTHADIFSYHYNVKENGNVDRMKDPHGELINQNVLISFGSEEETAEHFKLPLSIVSAVLASSRAKLHELRQKRPRPHLDDKMLTSWNGLMISGAAKAGQVLGEKAYIDRAIQAAGFVKKYLYLENDKVLLRSCYEGAAKEIAQIDPPIHGYLADYSFLIAGLLDLYEACFDCTWLEWANDLQETQNRIFWDDQKGGYFSSPADANVPLRLKDDQDGAEPCGNSIAVLNLIKLGTLLNNHGYREKAEGVLKSYGQVLEKTPIVVPAMMSGLMMFMDDPTQIFITGEPDDPDTAALVAVAHSRLIAGRILALADGKCDGFLYRNSDIIGGMKPVNGKPAAYVCRHRTCSLPVTSTEQLGRLLEK